MSDLERFFLERPAGLVRVSVRTMEHRREARQIAPKCHQHGTTHVDDVICGCAIPTGR